MIEVKNLKKSFHNHLVLKGINLTLETGTTNVIIGPSGSGKSTLLRCLNLLETPEEGFVQVGEVSYDASHLKKSDFLKIRQASTMVFQNYGLFPHKTVLENIKLALKVVKKINDEEASKIAFEYLTKVGLKEKADAYPENLSGGQAQRVAIARALALSPKVILFDEPTSALDPELVGEVLKVIKEIADTDATLVIVTHEMEFANQVGDHIIFMEEGQIIEEGTSEQIFENPQKARTKTFLARYRDNYMI